MYFRAYVFCFGFISLFSGFFADATLDFINLADCTDTKEVKKYLAPPNKRMQLYCKIYLWVSAVAVMLWSALMVYVFMGDGKDGEFCIYTQDLNNYHIILNDEPCLLQWYTLFVFFYLVTIFLVPVQVPVWILFLFLKRRQEKEG